MTMFSLLVVRMQIYTHTVIYILLRRTLFHRHVVAQNIVQNRKKTTTKIK